MKTVLITGCSSGYGLETARYFHRQGWNVIATMRSPRPGILPASDRIRLQPLDVTQPHSIARVVRDAGSIDVLVNNAGIGVVGAFEATAMPTIREVFDTNTFGTLAMCQAVIPQMRERRSGVIVNVDERMAERLRIARELHDTLLQTVQAGKLVADDALDSAADDGRRRHALERISTWLGEAIGEGRAALNALRQSTALGNDLADGLQQAADECTADSGMVIRVSIAGRMREMHPIVRDEIYRIGYEAIRNAAAHSQGRTLEIELAYARDLSLKVKDDGIGIEVDTFEQGKPGHFGIQGMRERALRIGAKLSVTRLAAGGTEVRLDVPGRTIFR